MNDTLIRIAHRRASGSARRGAVPVAARASAVLLAGALACADASALIRVSVHAEFPASGFAQGPVYGSVGPQAFDLAFDIEEAAAIHYAAGFEVLPGSVILGHDVYAIGYGAIKRGSDFTFGTQAFTGLSLHNLSYALISGGVLAAPMFLSDITPGSTPHIEAGLAPNFAGLGSYDFSPFVPGTLQTAFLTDQAQMFDGTATAFGTVSVRVSSIPELSAATLLLLGLLPLMLARIGRCRAGSANAQLPNPHGCGFSHSPKKRLAAVRRKPC